MDTTLLALAMSVPFHSGVYRETFLAILEAEEGVAFRLHGVILETRFLDRSAFDQPATSSFTEAEVRGALADLRFLAEFLRTVGREREASELPLRDWQLSQAAAESAGEVARIAERLDRELTRLLESEKPVADGE